MESKPARSARKPAAKKSTSVPAPITELIAHLNVRSSMLKPNITELIYNPDIMGTLPGAYNETKPVGVPIKEIHPDYVPPAEDPDAKLMAEADATIAAINAAATAAAATTSTNKTTIDNMILQIKTRDGYVCIPDTTNQCCYWDGHIFDNHPCAIPVRQSKRDGNVVYETDHRLFCSPECAAAQLFADTSDSFLKWERFALLNSAYRGMYKKGHTIRPAPPRDFLSVYGGTFTIEAFRDVAHEGRLRLDMLAPPMIAMNPAVDSRPADFYDAHLGNMAAETTVDKATTGLRLQRSKPRQSRDGALTLDRCFGVK